MTHQDHGEMPAGEPVSPAMTHARRVADDLRCPDRAYAAEDRLRWRSGVLVPPGYTATAEPSCSVTECLLEAGPEARLHLRLRFLHLGTRTVERAEGGSFHPVPELTVDGRTFRTFQEVTERETEVALCLSGLLRTGDMTTAVPAGPPADREGAGSDGGPYAQRRAGGGRGTGRGHPWPAGATGERTIMVGVPSEWSADPIVDAHGQIVGRSVSEHLSLRAAIRVRATRPWGPYGLIKLRVTVANTHGWADALAPREHALRRSLLATHLLIGVSGGAFLSPADPPEWAKEAAARCRCRHCRPVPAGPPGSREVLLSAPITLYDHPAIVPDHPGELIDRTDVAEPSAPRPPAVPEDRRQAPGGAGRIRAGTGAGAEVRDDQGDPGRRPRRDRQAGAEGTEGTGEGTDPG